MAFQGQVVAISPGEDHRVAALFYDKVLPVQPLNQIIPDEYRYKEIDDKISHLCTGAWLHYLIEKEIAKKRLPNGLIDIDGPLHLSTDNNSLNLFALTLKSILSKRNVSSVPLFLSSDSYNDIYKQGMAPVYEIVISNLPIIDLDDLTWDHIKEIRKNKDFKNKALKARTFLYENYFGKDKAYIVDSIQQKVMEFEESCKVNGLKFRYSIYKMILNGKSDLLKAAALGVALLKGLSIDPTVSIISAGVVAVGSILINIHEQKMELSENTNDEIALLMDISKALLKP